MEQERKIEKWLKAYAKKRRGRAGDSFKLDPATRQMLQNEVSRSVASDDEDETMSLWELLRKNWLYLMGFAACVFAVAALLLPSMYAPMNRSLQSASTLSDARSSEKVGAITNSNASVAAMTPPPPPPAALSGSLAQPSAPAPASDRLETAAGGVPAAQPEAIPPASPAPAIQPTTGIPASAAPGSIAMNSKQTKGFGGSGFSFVPASQKAASPSQSATVLVNFQVSQNGNTIRVVDHDGSVYIGSLEVEGSYKEVAPGVVSAAAQNNMPGQNALAAKTESPKAAQFDTSGGNANKGDNANSTPAGISGVSQSAADSDSPAVKALSPRQKYFFYAEGTNQTLRQSVVFAGTLMEDLSLAADTQQTFGMSANAALGAAYAQQFVRSVLTNQPIRIQGVAIIDQTFRIQINATSVPSKNSSPSK